jgi:argininosuccinate lyase
MNKSKLWGGRFTAPTAPLVESFVASIHFDITLIHEDILGSLAHAGMLAHCGIITHEECQLLQNGLRQIKEKIETHQVKLDIADEDIHMNVERLLGELIGEVAGKLHTGRSRNDQIALDLHLYLRKKTVYTVALLTQLIKVLIQQAERYQDIILPGYTHLQRAQPIRLAQHFLAYAAMFMRDSARLQNSWARVNQSPLGAAALAGTSLPIDRHYVAKELGFDTIYLNSLDAVSDRDFIVEFLASAALIMAHLSRLSEELILWSTQEFGFIELDDAYCTGSSIMPQKKNPDVPELVRGKTGRVYGALFNLLTILKALPLAYNKDLQEDKEPLFDTLNTLSSILEIYPSLLATLKIRAERMRQAVNDGYLNATDLADYLVKQGLTFRDAHEIAGNMVAYCIQQNCRLEELPLATMQRFSPLITQSVYELLKLENGVDKRESAGGTALSAIQTQFIAIKQQLSDLETWITEKQALLDQVNILITPHDVICHPERSVSS